MSGRVRLVVSDIDGTLVRHDKSLSDGVVAAARRLQDAGILLSLISARPPSGMRWIAEKLGLKTPIGAFNGGTVVDPAGGIVLADRIDPAAAKQAIEVIDTPGITPWLFAGGHWYAQTLDNDHVAHERLAANVEPIILADFASLTGSIDKIVGVSDDHALLAGLEAKARASLGDRATIARSQPYYLDFTGPRANKGYGVEALAAAIGVPLESVVVIGDQHNDLAMFARAGLSIAMAQAPPDVRAAADRVTCSNDDDGVAHAIEQLLSGSWT